MSLNQSKKGSLFQRVVSLLVKPADFFNEVKHSSNEREPILWFGVSVAVYILFSLILSYFALSTFDGSSLGIPSDVMEDVVDQKWAEVLIGVVATGLFVLLTLWLMPLWHWLVQKMGVNVPKYQTVKALLYPAVPAYLFSWLPWVSLIALLVSLYAYYKAFKILLEINTKQIVLFSIVASIIGVVLLLVLSMFVVLFVSMTGLLVVPGLD